MKNELNLILKNSLSDIEIQVGKKPEEIKIEDWLFNNREYLPEKHELKNCSFPGYYVATILKRFPDDRKAKHKTKTRKWNDLNGKDFQICVMEMREDFQGKGYLTGKQSLDSRRGVIKKYKKSLKNDLVRLCWKFITDEKELEGVHYPWLDPKKL